MNIQLPLALPLFNKMKNGLFDDYMAKLAVKTDEFISFHKILSIKISDDELKIPNMKTYKEMCNCNYSLTQLKIFAKYYKLRVTGNKKELLSRVFSFLHLSKFAVQIQKIVRGNIQRLYNLLHGPAYKNRTLCTNDSDFVTLDDLKDISFHQFISYKDVDGFIYGFDIASLYSLYSKNPTTVQNPYNRNTIAHNIFVNMFDLVRLSKIMNIKLNVQIESEINNVSVVKAVELRALELFQTIDSLGNYSDPTWFLSLTRNQIIRFVRELSEIFNYRAQLTQECKENICPPTGTPFVGISQHYMQTETEIINIRRTVLGVMEKFVNSGINSDSKSLGAYYVLAALTLVSDPAATALPWLYHSVAYF
jgi:hypothetical protein